MGDACLRPLDGLRDGNAHEKEEGQKMSSSGTGRFSRPPAEEITDTSVVAPRSGAEACQEEGAHEGPSDIGVVSLSLKGSGRTGL